MNKCIPAFPRGHPFICQVYGLPDHGVTRAVMSLVAGLLKADTAKTALFIFCDSGTCGITTFNCVAKEAKGKLLAASDTYSSYESILNLLDSYKACIDYVIIDDSARLLINHRRRYINDFLSGLRKIADNNKVSIFIINQLRYQVGKATAASASDLKPLYYEYLGPYLDYDLKVTRSGMDINVSAPIEHQKSLQENPLDFLLGTIEEAEPVSAIPVCPF